MSIYFVLNVLHRHRAINLFLNSYKEQWLGTEECEKKVLIEDLTVSIAIPALDKVTKCL